MDIDKRNITCHPSLPSRCWTSPTPVMDITITTTTTAGETGPSAIPACCYPPPAACTGSGASSTNNQSRVLAFLRALAAFCWAASRGALGKMFLAYLQSTVNPTWRSLVASLGVGVGSTAPGGGIPVVVDVDDDDDDAQGRRPLADAHHTDAGASAAANSKKVSWSYLRGAYHVRRFRSLSGG